jgi:hypothetical protein
VTINHVLGGVLGLLGHKKLIGHLPNTSGEHWSWSLACQFFCSVLPTCYDEMKTLLHASESGTWHLCTFVGSRPSRFHEGHHVHATYAKLNTSDTSHAPSTSQSSFTPQPPKSKERGLAGRLLTAWANKAKDAGEIQYLLQENKKANVSNIVAMLTQLSRLYEPTSTSSLWSTTSSRGRLQVHNLGRNLVQHCLDRVAKGKDRLSLQERIAFVSALGRLE